MNYESGLDYKSLQRALDVLLDENCRIIRENELLKAELLNHASGADKIRSIEDSLASAYREYKTVMAVDGMEPKYMSF